MTRALFRRLGATGAASCAALALLAGTVAIAPARAADAASPASPASPASAAAPVAPDAPAAAARIDAALPALRERSRMVAGLSAEGANVTAWSNGSVLRKVEVEMLGESGRDRLSFYWNDGELVAARRVRIDYDGTLRDGAAGRERVRLDRWQTWRKGTPIFLRGAATEASRRDAADLQAQARAYARLMQRRPPTPDCEWACSGEDRSGCVRFSCR